MKTARIFTGAMIWSALVCLCAWWASETQVSDGNLLTTLVPEVARYSTGQRRTRSLAFEDPSFLAVGDPVFIIKGPNDIRQVGEVSRLPSGVDNQKSGAFVREADVLFYHSAPDIGRGASLRYHTTPDSMEWVLRTMLPPAKRNQVATEVRDAVLAHRKEVILALSPIVEASVRDSLMIVEEDLPGAMRRHRREFERLGIRYQDEIVRQEIVPLVRKEIWPIVQTHLEPVATEVGHEMWDQASLWRFGWRYVYDKSVGPKKSLVKGEWDRFVRQEGIPILQRHTSDFIRVQQRVLADVVRNDEVRRAVRKNLSRLSNDPELKALVWSIIQETLVDNPRTRAVLQRHWQSPEALAAFQLAIDRFEPTVVRIGQLLFGDEENGISPEFARVLRHEILGKDRRWLVLEGSQSGSDFDSSPSGRLVVRSNREPEINPFAHFTYSYGR